MTGIHPSSIFFYSLTKLVSVVELPGAFDLMLLISLILAYYYDASVLYVSTNVEKLYLIIISWSGDFYIQIRYFSTN